MWYRKQALILPIQLTCTSALSSTASLQNLHWLPIEGEYISNWPPWRIRYSTLAIRLTCLNCYNNMNPHGLCDLPLLFSSLFHDTTLNLACMNFKSPHQKSGIYCLLVSIILHHSLHFGGIYKHIIFSQPILTPNNHPLSMHPDSL